MVDTLAHTRDTHIGKPVVGALAVPQGDTAGVDLISHGDLVSPVVVSGAARLAELALACLVGIAIGHAYVPAADLWHAGQYVFAIAATGIATVSLFHVLGLYQIAALSQALRHMPRIALGWLAANAALIAVVFFMKAGPEFSRVWLALWVAGGGTALVAGRLAMAALVQHWMRQGRLTRRAVILGAGPASRMLADALTRDAESDVRVCGIFDDRVTPTSRNDVDDEPASAGALADLIAFARRTRIDIVIVALPMRAERRLVEMMRALRQLPVDIKLWEQASELKLARRAYSTIGSVRFLDIADRPIADWGSVVKWAFDKVVALAAIVLLAPLMLATAVAIRLESRGPVLFRQKRYGFNNELIEVLKFRSMYVDQCDTDASKLVSRHDPRVTRVGRFIRQTSIDELPQLFNVLRGDLSLVGPRPHALAAKAGSRLYDEVVEDYFARHKVKPGITGWAQINGWRGETDTDEKIRKRVEHDLYYIENWSLMLDLYILIKTPFALVRSDNAY
ncbi:MAG: undecaprenyl-phosphate glucose phosphotransferase [Hyphomicrobiaceae bacterium]